jgi:hypothetical protein
LKELLKGAQKILASYVMGLRKIHWKIPAFMALHFCKPDVMRVILKKTWRVATWLNRFQKAKLGHIPRLALC